jgi:hypothetical protein
MQIAVLRWIKVVGGRGAAVFQGETCSSYDVSGKN